MKIAIVFDNQLRTETTGLYVCRALRALDIEHLLPHELAQVPVGTFDLFLFVDDGLDYAIPQHVRPRAAWAIDTHINFARSVERFGDADWVFAAQKQGADAMQMACGRPVKWLPLACDPDRHRRFVEFPVLYDFCFIGHEIGSRRREFLNRLRGKFKNHWIGQAFHQEMAKRYSQSKVAFNCSINNDVNMRIFEAMACGTALVTDHIENNGLETLFDVGKHLLCFSGFDQLCEHIERLLIDHRQREKQAVDAFENVISRHTYSHRMRAILDEVTKPFVTGQASRKTDPTKDAEITKSEPYFEFERPDVVALVPLEAKRVLDIGCGAGRFGESLKLRQACAVIGIELSETAVAKAKKRLDAVVAGNIESVASDTFGSGEFDCIVFADVLEHLRNPRAALLKCSEWLSRNGTLVISIPNSRHHSVVRGLIEGNWTYERAGLLDEDHVRCFTRREIEKLLYRVGFEITRCEPVWGSGKHEWDISGNPDRLDFGSFQVGDLAANEIEEFFVYQYVIASRKRPKATFGLTSIVICTYNQLAYTIQCVESILARTDTPYELIFVDNNSSDGTVNYLSSISGAKLILNDSNRGFAPACNQGMQVANGQQVLLLNNDTVVTTGWLEQLLDALYDRADTAMVGPVSNNVSGPQQIGVCYRDLVSLDGFAWNRRNERRLIETDRLVGFCLLIRRDVIDRIGLLDEQYEIGCFEDDDWCKRAILAGYKIYIAQHVFVHHFGSVTFKASGVNFEQLLQKNQQRFESKWASPEASRNASAAGDIYNEHQLANGEFLLKRRHVHLSLCMIVRDNERTIADCLASIYPWVDEIIIVDTGSLDQTVEICESFGTKVLHFRWCDDFSAARNVSLGAATGEWVFWMDSDDVIDPEQGKLLRELAYRSHHPNTYGYVLRVHCPSGNGGQMTIVDHVKLFRHLPNLRFEHRIHEQILPSIRRAGGEIEFTDVFVLHTGSRQSAETRIKKLERDFRILELDLREHPDHPFVLFNLGMTHEDAGQYDQAEQYLKRCIEIANPGESQLRKAWALRVSCARELGQWEVAIKLADEALSLFPGDKELCFRRAVLLQDSGQFSEAIKGYEAILGTPMEREFQSVDPSICGSKAWHNMAIAQQSLGRFDDAIVSYRNAIAEKPEFPATWVAIVRCHLARNQIDCARMEVARIPGLVDALTKVVCQAMIFEACGEMEEAAQLIASYNWDAYEYGDHFDDLARILVNSGRPALAIPFLQRMHEMSPRNAATLHNLGLCMKACGEISTAIAVLNKSTELRPNEPSTMAMLRELYAEQLKRQQPTDCLNDGTN